ncbi:MAG TPA: biopolymer transporter ExbD [Rhizomicrobium sp.]|jgi:biopolymer transport protein ExbD|nr:biopolymer transporter ExbD [Rhizomicrobium sp.]
MAMTRGTDGGMLSEMNTTPLIDVMLVLLTLLIVTLPLQTHAVKLQLPVPSPVVQPPPFVLLDVAFDGAIAWNGTRVDRATLDADLARAAQSTPQPDIHIRPDRLARYDAVAMVLADAQRLGATHIGLDGTERYGR